MMYLLKKVLIEIQHEQNVFRDTIEQALQCKVSKVLPDNLHYSSSIRILMLVMRFVGK